MAKVVCNSTDRQVHSNKNTQQLIEFGDIVPPESSSNTNGAWVVTVVNLQIFH